MLVVVTTLLVLLAAESATAAREQRQSNRRDDHAKEQANRDRAVEKRVRATPQRADKPPARQHTTLKRQTRNRVSELSRQTNRQTQFRNRGVTTHRNRTTTTAKTRAQRNRGSSQTSRRTITQANRNTDWHSARPTKKITRTRTVTKNTRVLKPKKAQTIERKRIVKPRSTPKIINPGNGRDLKGSGKSHQRRGTIIQRPDLSTNRHPRNNIGRTNNVSKADRKVKIRRTATHRGGKTVINRTTRIEKNINNITVRNNMTHRSVNKTVSRPHRPRGTVTSHHRNRGDRGHSRSDKHVHFHNSVHGRDPGRIFHRVTRPSYHHRVHYRRGRRTIVRYVRPYYHRKYIFVSIGGYWPLTYRSTRYYWYGWHPYSWYGHYPTAYHVEGPEYNYYTYNNYYSSAGGGTTSYSTNYSPALTPVDHTTFEDVREKLTEQAAEEPESETLADKFFEDGVKAFEEGKYVDAASAFADAVNLEPDDVILPFAYAQALFASEQYARSAEILRLALAAMPADEQGLFFPRGLYQDDQVLLDQIEQLGDKAKIFSYDPDMALLLGYQLLGTEEYDQAREWLNSSANFEINKESSTLLLELLEQIESELKPTI